MSRRPIPTLSAQPRATATPIHAGPTGLQTSPGHFRTPAIGLTASITGLVPTHPSNESSTFDPLVPASLSFIDYTNETPGNALSYNNLFFPAGSPIDCAYPLDGTFLDVFGTAFTVAGGDTVDFWGDGNAGPGGALTCGIGVTDGTNLLDYKFAGVSAAVPGTRICLVARRRPAWSTRVEERAVRVPCRSSVRP